MFKKLFKFFKRKTSSKDYKVVTLTREIEVAAKDLDFIQEVERKHRHVVERSAVHMNWAVFDGREETKPHDFPSYRWEDDYE